MYHAEEKLQEVCVRILKYRYSDIYLNCHHSPNEGKRTEFQGAILQKMGLQVGWPDLEIMVPSMGYHGLFIEFKTKKGRQTKEQKQVQEALEAQGYRYEIIRDPYTFTDLVHEYLGEEKDPDVETLRKLLQK